MCSGSFPGPFLPPQEWTTILVLFRELCWLREPALADLADMQRQAWFSLAFGATSNEARRGVFRVVLR